MKQLLVARRFAWGVFGKGLDWGERRNKYKRERRRKKKEAEGKEKRTILLANMAIAIFIVAIILYYTTSGLDDSSLAFSITSTMQVIIFTGGYGLNDLVPLETISDQFTPFPSLNAKKLICNLFQLS